MNCEIITIGDELLIGQVIDTNSSWMAARLNEIGVRVVQKTTVSDDPAHITEAIRRAETRAAVILMTGGLGPTKDDLTKDTLCRYFNTELVMNSKVEADLVSYFSARGRELTETNRKQAELPAACKPLYNKLGTAPGMLFEKDNRVYISLPGVPYEMKDIMTEQVIPLLKIKAGDIAIFHYTMMTIGVGESFLADLISDVESGLPPYIKLAYLPSPGMVRLRLSCYGSNEEKKLQVLDEVNKIKVLISKYIYGYNDETIEMVVGNLLREKGNTVSFAESCTGGYLSHLVTSIPGSSDYYIGSSISYANEVKSKFLGVDPEVIHEKGAVSEEVALAMAKGVRSKLGSTWAVSTTGVAGPGGGTPEKPVGTIWIGLDGPSGSFAKKFNFAGDRLRNIQLTGAFALNMLRKELIGERDN
ncbi:MAG TPA: competence/damage-inducible protein A [Bacteroidia bacterium]|nr:competence/damage-inducible protein A [Bacteroidia bacterium]